MKSIAYSGSLHTGYDVCFSSDATGAQAYLWDFGDGYTSDLPTPCHTYNDTGDFKVTLTLNRTATLSKSMTIKIAKAPKNTTQLAGSRRWKHVHGTSVAGTVTTIIDPDTTFAINYLDPATISIGSTTLKYASHMSSGENILAFYNVIDGLPIVTTLYFFDAPVDSFRLTIDTHISAAGSSFERFTSP